MKDLKLVRQKTEDRWHYIDLMEFIGMLFVVIYHATIYSYSWLETNSVLYFIRYYIRTILSTGVPLFFFANGYLLFNRKFCLKKHIVKTIKLIFLTGIWGTINLFLIMIIEKEYLSLKEFLEYLWTWHYGWLNYLWYMGALVCIYVFFPLLKIAFDNEKRIFIYFIIVSAILTFGNVFINYGVSIVLNQFGLYKGIVNWNWFNMFNPFRGIYGYSFVYFCIGGLAHDIVGKLKDIPQKKRNILSITAILIGSLGLFMMGIVLSGISGEIWDVVWGGYDTIFVLTIVCAMFVLCLSYNGGKNRIELVSVNTLGIYFTHEIIIHLTRNYVRKIPIAENFVGCIVYAVAIMYVCLLLSQLLGKIPGIRKLIRI